MEFLKTLTLCSIFPGFAEIIFHHMGCLIEMIYLDLLNLNKGSYTVAGCEEIYWTFMGRIMELVGAV